MAVNARFMLVLFLNFVSADLRGQGFLEKRPTVHTSSIRSELDGILGQGHGVSQDQLTKINSTLLPIFRALPKNSRGHLSTRIMRYAMRRYFSSSHAWIVKGFEEFGDAINSTNDDTDIVQSKVPGFVQSALEQRFQHQGFSLNDMVSMVGAIEALVFNEVVRGVMLGFYYNSFEMGSILNRQQMSEVMDSYLITELLPGSTDFQQHQQNKARIDVRYPNWHNAKMFLNDISGSDGFGRHTTANPFKEQDYVFEDIVRMAGRISEEFGPWSSYECHQMKDYLSEKDVHGTGRVKLSDFYGASDDGDSAWHFTEPTAHLRVLGALDESSSYLGPQVIIPNYINAMSNCISSHPYFSICCLNECDSIYEHIEDEIGSPNATLSQILPAVEMLPSHPNISQNLINKLKDVATIHGGSIPLHGRLFAQWLHFAFPRDCPYPHAGAISPKTQQEWWERIGETPTDRAQMLDKEITQHMKADYSKRDPSPDAGIGMWTFEESLMEFSTPSDAQDATWAWFLRIACHLAVVMAFGSVLVREAYKNLYSAKKGDTKKYSV